MLNRDDILSIVGSEIDNCERTDDIVARKRTAQSYYAGDLPAPPSIKGRSGVVSTDVADSVEWILPNIVESLSGRAVKFMPLSAQDEAQAELETDYTHHVWSEENPGYLNLLEASKDALMTGVGILKICYDDVPERVVENYSGLMEPQLQALLGDPMIEVTEIERSETDGIAVTCARIVKNGSVRVECVPIEEFRVNDDHDSLDLREARFVAHTRRRSASDLLSEGYDPDLIDEAQEHNLDRELDVYNYTDPSIDESMKMLVVTECYLRVDINEDGIAELCKVTVLGETTPNEILDIEEIAEVPFVAMSAIPKPHEFCGTSIFERVRQIQDLKTAVVRSTLDSYYQNVNKQKVVQEGQVNLDDLLVSRPGGIIRAKGHNAVTEIGGTPLGPEGMALLQWADEQKRSRVGVSTDMAGQNQLVNNESAHAVERLMSAQEMLGNLIVRSIAETGIRPAYRMIRDLLVRFQNATTPFKFRGNWVNVNPADWGDRSRMMVTVGTGAGEDQQRMASLQQIYQIQREMQQSDPMQSMVAPGHLFATLNDFIGLSGLSEASKYFADPNSPEGQQFAQQKAQEGMQQQQQAMEQQQQQLAFQQQALEAQQKVANAELQKAQATQMNGQLKAQIDAMKAAHTQEIDQIKTAMQAIKDDKKQAFDYDKLRTDAALRLTELEVQAKRDLSQQNADNEAGKVDAEAAPEASQE